MSELTQAQIKITPFKISRFQIAIKGLSPLVMHAWSEKAKAILADFDNYLPKFVHVYPSSEAGEPEVSGVEKAAVADGELVSA